MTCASAIAPAAAASTAAAGEAVSAPGGAESADFASLMNGLVENSGGDGGQRGEERGEADSQATPATEVNEPPPTVTEAVLLASLAQLWLPPAPKPLTQPTPSDASANNTEGASASVGSAGHRPVPSGDSPLEMAAAPDFSVAAPSTTSLQLVLPGQSPGAPGVSASPPVVISQAALHGTTPAAGPSVSRTDPTTRHELPEGAAFPRSLPVATVTAESTPATSSQFIAQVGSEVTAASAPLTRRLASAAETFDPPPVVAGWVDTQTDLPTRHELRLPNALTRSLPEPTVTAVSTPTTSSQFIAQVGSEVTAASTPLTRRLAAAAETFDPPPVVAPLRDARTDLPTRHELPLPNAFSRSLPEATVTAVSTTATDSQFIAQVGREVTATNTPLTRRFASAAETLFTEVAEQPETTRAETPAPPAGTGTAEQGGGMKHGPNQKQFAESAADYATPLFAEGELARRGGARTVPASSGYIGVDPDTNLPLASMLSLNSPATPWLDEPGAVLAAAPATAGAAAELLQTGLMRHVSELRYTGATEMAVVLKPDADTQLALRLSFNAQGEVTVQARCEQGDAQALAANWGDIRHALAQQGVRLGALEFSPERSPDRFNPQAGNGGPSPDGQPSSQRHGQPWPETLDDLPLVGSLTEPPTRRGVRRMPAGRGKSWESWA